MTEAFGGETESRAAPPHSCVSTRPPKPHGAGLLGRGLPAVTLWSRPSCGTGSQFQQGRNFINLLYDPILQWRKGGRCLEGWAASPAKDVVSGARLPPRPPLPLPLGTAPLCSASKIGGGCG